MRIIAGEWGGRTIRAPRGRDVRPTTDRIREAWMGALGDRVVEARVLDLFAGSGALGLEALSRGATEAVFVERARAALAALEANVQMLGAGDRVRIVKDDAFRFLARLDANNVFDLALADPPYGQGDAQRLVEMMAARPFARELWVEHGSSEPVVSSRELRHRRYGDTTISIMEATA